MPFGNMGPWQILLILLIILLIFGAARLPALAKSMGQSARAFKGEMKQMKEEDASAKAEGSATDTSASGESAAQPTSDTPPSEPKP
ncbi:twin-arginine translocase TatA/TatE family subunit [Microbacterium amylolyticum]|uniref:Sec-independent protein translocase protein TatA n=1 Tax=Microbacterium amylolyticum TaxID=936337 RepID=A0ABS4ZFI0_9MICO|nr:twin-arginine translocase TatA/TatE family subunit [Microbacterium amylolyticum]MBP2435798.1 sec-independent protein translocase protein TatA [Microbacterium amylolyticum]